MRSTSAVEKVSSEFEDGRAFTLRHSRTSVRNSLRNPSKSKMSPNGIIPAERAGNEISKMIATMVVAHICGDRARKVG